MTRKAKVVKIELPTPEEFERRAGLFSRGHFISALRASRVPAALADALPEFARIRGEREALLARERQVDEENRAARERIDAKLAERSKLRRDAQLSGAKTDLPPLVRMRDEHGLISYRESMDGIEDLPWPLASADEWNYLHELLEAEELHLLRVNAGQMRRIVDAASAKAEGAVAEAKAVLARAEQEMQPFETARRAITVLMPDPAGERA